jgi:hypothetical protein
MLFKRSLISNASLMPTPMRAGDGFLGNPVVTEKTTNADHTITVAEMSTGVLYYSALSAGRAVTTPTAALILAAAPDMDVGDSFVFLVSIQDAFAITWVAGSGVTLAGRTTTPASSSTWIVVTKTSDTTVTWFVA